MNPEQEMNQQQRNIKSQFVSLLSECENNENLNIDTLESMLQDLYAPSKPTSVKLMTIHQAKGLEFDIVILPGLGKTGKSNPSSLIQIQEFSNHNILLAPIKSAYDKEESKTYLYLKYIEKQQSHFELTRLLYVAMSRAKEKLYLLGSVNKSGKVSSNTFLYLLSHFYQESIDNLENFPEENIKQLVAPKMIRYAELPTLSERETQHINEPKNLSRNIDLIYQSALGTIVHYFLEHSLFEPSEKSVEIKLLEFGLPKKLLHTYTLNKFVSYFIILSKIKCLIGYFSTESLLRLKLNIVVTQKILLLTDYSSRMACCGLLTSKQLHQQKMNLLMPLLSVKKNLIRSNS